LEGTASYQLANAAIWGEGNCIIIPMPEEVQSKEIAFYYPGAMWHYDYWIKTMILFFDGIGILLPDYLHGKPEAQDPAVAISAARSGATSHS
jgi:hypothetical protein